MHEKDPSNPLSKEASCQRKLSHRDTDIRPENPAYKPNCAKRRDHNHVYTIGHSKNVTLQVQKEEMVWGRKEITHQSPFRPQKAKEINFWLFLLLASPPQNIFVRLPHPSARFRIRARFQPDLSFSSSTVW